MKTYLLFPDRDPAPPGVVGPLQQALLQDLDLATVVGAMSAGDPELLRIATAVLLAPAPPAAVVAFRQDVLDDCLRAPTTARKLYALAADALAEEHRIWGWSEHSASSVLLRSLQVLGVFLAALRRLIELARAEGPALRSAGFRRLVAELNTELDDAFFREAAAHMERLRHRSPLLLSTGVGPEARPTEFTLRAPREERRRAWQRLLPARRNPRTVVIGDRDETGHRYLSDLTDRGLEPAAAALGRAADHLLQFLQAFRDEVGFYVGALNLADRLAATGNPVCRPRLDRADGPACDAQGLFDVGLALHLGKPVVANDVLAGGRRLVLLTGANRGGKSTLLRALGLAQLMAQAGLFVGARGYVGGVAAGVYTHFRRAEDPGMTRGKLEEELARLRTITEAIRPGALLLCNESLSSTNEQEGSEIADQVVRALVGHRVTVYYVTFLFEFADAWQRRAPQECLCLRVERRSDGSRSFRLVPGEPLPTSFAEDLYHQIWDAPPGPGPIRVDRDGSRRSPSGASFRAPTASPAEGGAAEGGP